MKKFQSIGKVLTILIVFLPGYGRSHVTDPIVGNWTFSNLAATGCTDKSRNFSNPCTVIASTKCELVTFDADGIYTYVNSMGSPSSGKGTYSIVGNTITIVTNGVTSKNTFTLVGRKLTITTAPEPTSQCTYIETFVKS